jgi:hypothetical protein
MKSISKEIKLNVLEMNDVQTSPYHIVYKDENFFFVNKRHNVPKLLRLGFMVCKHYSEEQ